MTCEVLTCEGHARVTDTLTDPILVVGLGQTGLACARYLAAQGRRVMVTDTRADPPGRAELERSVPQAERFLGGLARAAFARARTIVLSPGVARGEPPITEALARGIPVIGDIELFARVARAPIVAITGSNGKSTVTSLLAEMAREDDRAALAGGNLGRPALELLDEPTPELYVLELSSFQLESTYSLQAAAAAVLNVSADHMDRYADIDEYAAAKARIYIGAQAMVVNADDPRVHAMRQSDRTAIEFTLGVPGAGQFGVIDHDGGMWLGLGAEPWVPVIALRMPGRHNVANALAALALGRAVGLASGPMIDALRRFSGLPHRTQWIGERDGIAWYDDSKGTNVGATVAAVEGMAGPVVLIAGGDGKGADFRPLREVLARKARGAVLIGRDAPQIAAVLDGVVPVVRAQDMEEAVRAARELARSGDQVLLSPACASFDMYRDYAERGEHFATAVRRGVL